VVAQAGKSSKRQPSRVRDLDAFSRPSNYIPLFSLSRVVVNMVLSSILPFEVRE